MNQIIPATLFLVTLAFSGLINTEAGTFRCYGTIVQLDRHGIPSSEEDSVAAVRRELGQVEAAPWRNDNKRLRCRRINP